MISETPSSLDRSLSQSAPGFLQEVPVILAPGPIIQLTRLAASQALQGSLALGGSPNAEKAYLGLSEPL